MMIKIKTFKKYRDCYSASLIYFFINKMLNNYLTETIPIREGCSIFDIFLLENGIIALIISY